MTQQETVVTALSDVIIIVVPRGVDLQKNLLATRIAWWKEADHGDKFVLVLPTPRCGNTQHL